jgi:hypothetical protein
VPAYVTVPTSLKISCLVMRMFVDLWVSTIKQQTFPFHFLVGKLAQGKQKYTYIYGPL